MIEVFRGLVQSVLICYSLCNCVCLSLVTNTHVRTGEKLMFIIKLNFPFFDKCFKHAFKCDLRVLIVLCTNEKKYKKVPC